MPEWVAEAVAFCARSGLACLPLWVLLLRCWPYAGGGESGISRAVRRLAAMAAVAGLCWVPSVQLAGSRLPPLWHLLGRLEDGLALAYPWTPADVQAPRLQGFRDLLRLRPGQLRVLRAGRAFQEQCLRPAQRESADPWDVGAVLRNLPPGVAPLDLPAGAPPQLSCREWWGGADGWSGLRREILDELMLRLDIGEGQARSLLVPALAGAADLGRTCAWPYDPRLCPLVRTLAPQPLRSALRALAGLLTALAAPAWILLGAVWGMSARLLAVAAALHVLAAALPLWLHLSGQVTLALQASALSGHDRLVDALDDTASLAALTAAEALPWAAPVALLAAAPLLRLRP